MEARQRTGLFFLEALKSAAYHVYIVECADGTYYTGSTNDLENRLKKHNSGAGAKYLRGRGPVRVVYLRRCRSKSSALKFEAKIKALDRSKKMEIIKMHQMISEENQ